MNITINQTQKIIAALEILSSKKLTADQKIIVDEAYEAIHESAKKQIEINAKSYERIKKRREENYLLKKRNKQKNTLNNLKMENLNFLDMAGIMNKFFIETLN